MDNVELDRSSIAMSYNLRVFDMVHKMSKHEIMN